MLSDQHADLRHEVRRKTASGIVVAIRMYETHPRTTPQSAKGLLS
jgi:hypothetical protein